VTKVAKKKGKALKNLKKDVARLTKQNDKLAERLEKTREDQAAELEEIRNLVEERLAAQDAAPAEQGDNPRDGDESSEVMNAAQRRAKELDVDLSGIKGTGSRGRILVKDVEAAATTRA
jgi:pyruvate/2-oxoglutarate dehydrogenase complex dihydrolipoamide acyltransferase (E2) component